MQKVRLRDTPPLLAREREPTTGAPLCEGGPRTTERRLLSEARRR